MALVQDLILQTANAPGTGTFNLIAPPTGRVSWITGTGAGQVFYFAHDGTAWEKGVGTVVSGSPDTLSRDTVRRNNSGTTSKVNFTGTVQVYCDIPSEHAIFASADNLSVPFGGRLQSGLGAGTAADHSPRLDQVGWERITATVFGVTTASVTFSLPTQYDRYRVEWQNVSATVSANMYIVISENNLVSFIGGASGYYADFNGSLAGAAVVGSGSGVQFNVDQAGNLAKHGYVELDPYNYQINARGNSANSTTMGRLDSTGYWAGTTRPTHVALAPGSTSFAGGRFRLLGARF